MTTEGVYKIYREGAKNKAEAMLADAAIATPGIEPDEVQRRYDIWAPNYAKDVGLLDWNAPDMVAGEMASYLRGKTSAKILDCAAGSGQLGICLIKHGYTNIDALDMNTAMLEEANKKGVYINLIQGRLGSNKLDILDNTYDALTMTGALYEGHVKPDCFPELARIVKPGGFIIFGMRELNLVDSVSYVNLEMMTHNMEKCGVWRQLMRKVQPGYLNGGAGIIWCFTPL